MGSESLRQSVYDIPHLKQSPCRICPKWKGHFPACQYHCPIVAKAQDIIFSGDEKCRIEQGGSIKKPKSNHQGCSREEIMILFELAELVQEGKTFCDVCETKDKVLLDACRIRCEKFRLQEKAGVRSNGLGPPASAHYVVETFLKIKEKMENEEVFTPVGYVKDIFYQVIKE